MNRHPLSHPTGATMRIGGEVVSRINARYDYRCEVCLSALVYHNNGLACSKDKSHRGFIHKKEATRIAELQEKNIKELEQVYVIVDGKVTTK